MAPALTSVVLANKEYLPMVEDIVRMMTIQITLQFLLYINGNENAFFTGDFFMLLVYIALGVCVYWLIIKKCVSFR